MEGIQTLLSLTAYHHNVMIPDLHNIILALTAQVKNLRSSVSRLAINCLGDMFNKLKKGMDHVSMSSCFSYAFQIHYDDSFSALRKGLFLFYKDVNVGK